ncbi:kunitz-type serine protease inhibitor A [Rhipicephalus sanguineus]|uniref:kunitz-type serine protease inhibitor A n=1 Tax=Rhipicephalus sanguineus TaxID=34632 RepID=UPI0018959837|nr:kunitz-type serine protease inhibitor A [Rhipicephalus sanguineus]
MIIEARTLILIASSLCFVIGIPRGCLIAPRTGRCGLIAPRWYYNATSKRCRPVMWGGCGYGGNVFRTSTECEGKCGGSYQANADRCLIVPRNHNCSHDKPSVLMWSFHMRSMTCIASYFNGCDGNKNLFRTCKICYKECLLHTTRVQVCTDNPPRREPSPQRYKPGTVIEKRPKL